MSVTMTRDEMKAFLDEPWIASIATLTKTGHPHVTPIWSDYDGEHFWSSLVDGNPKTRALERDNRVSLCFGNDNMPYKAVLVHGTVELIRGDARPIVHRLARKYVGEEKAEWATDALMSSPQVIVKVTPQRIYTWDQSKVTFAEAVEAEKSGAAFRTL